VVAQAWVRPRKACPKILSIVRISTLRIQENSRTHYKDGHKAAHVGSLNSRVENVTRDQFATQLASSPAIVLSAGKGTRASFAVTSHGSARSGRLPPQASADLETFHGHSKARHLPTFTGTYEKRALRSMTSLFFLLTYKPKLFRLYDMKQLHLAEVMSWLGKRSYATRVQRFGIERIREIARQNGKKGGRPPKEQKTTKL
jgi:hypothetical protein